VESHAPHGTKVPSLLRCFQSPVEWVRRSSLNTVPQCVSFLIDPLPHLLFCCATSSLTRYIDMPGSAVADIRDTYGAAFMGLLVSTVCVFSLLFHHPLADLAKMNISLYGVTMTQT
jgi:hypothetical protein